MLPVVLCFEELILPLKSYHLALYLCVVSRFTAEAPFDRSMFGVPSLRCFLSLPARGVCVYVSSKQMLVASRNSRLVSFQCQLLASRSQ